MLYRRVVRDEGLRAGALERVRSLQEPLVFCPQQSKSEEKLHIVYGSKSTNKV